MNLSGTLNAFRLLSNPALALPHLTVPTFNHLPIPLSKAFPPDAHDKDADIRAVILDKDNCFAIPHENDIYKPYKDKFDELRAAYPGSRLLIVSNTAGTPSDRDHAEARLLERSTGVRVLRHSDKKPGCRDDVLSYFRSAADVDITSPAQIAVVGDRLLTDVLMANLMGSRAIWVREGVAEKKSFYYHAETRLAAFLSRRGYIAPEPQSDFE